MLSLLADELLILSSFNCGNGCLETVVASIFVLVALVGVCLDVVGGFCGFFCDFGAMNFKFIVYYLLQSKKLNLHAKTLSDLMSSLRFNEL